MSKWRTIYNIDHKMHRFSCIRIYDPPNLFSKFLGFRRKLSPPLTYIPQSCTWLAWQLPRRVSSIVCYSALRLCVGQQSESEGGRLSGSIFYLVTVN